jgi:preprotein translocase subunit SecD
VILAVVIAALAAWTFWPGQDHTPKLGLDLQGGTQVILTPNVTDGESAEITQEQLDQTVNIIRARIDGSGVAEAVVTTQGSGANAAIVVSVPGQLTQAQQDGIAATAKLDFRPVLAADSGIPIPLPSATPSPSASEKKKSKNNTKKNETASATPTATPTAEPSAEPTAAPAPTTEAGPEEAPATEGNGAVFM